MPDEEPWSPAAFEARYAVAPDPWSFATSTYERERYETILSALRPRPHRYHLGFEPACSVGVLTAALVERCDRIVASDVSASAVARARVRCSALNGVRIDVGSVQDGPGTDEPVDLVVFSELGYYFAADELPAIVTGVRDLLAPGGDLIACHWTGESPDHRLSGTTVHDVMVRTLEADAGLVRSELHDGFVLGVWHAR